MTDQNTDHKTLTVSRTASYRTFGGFCRTGGGVRLDSVNWPDRFPDKPEVRFFVAYTGTSVLLRYEVSERLTLGRVREDNGPVWTDSCVEFFISFDGTGYYNFEFNCLGTALLAFRKEKDMAEHASTGIMSSIRRGSSLAGWNMDEVCHGLNWSLDVEIPYTAFFRHPGVIVPGCRARGNFYKCGDGLPEPHFLTWNPVGTPDPDFHREEFFGHINFR